MNDLQRRFNKSRLTLQQKARIVEEVKHKKTTFRLVPIIVPIFLLLAVLFTLLSLQTAPLDGQTTAAYSSQVLSLNYYLNTVNILLIIGNVMYILKLIKDGQWKMSAKRRAVIEKIYILFVIVAIVGYTIIEVYIGTSSYYKEIMFMLLLLMLVVLVVCCPTDAVAGKGVIRYKYLLILSVFVYAVSFVMSLMIDRMTYLDATMTMFTFPLKHGHDQYMFGTIGAILFIGSLMGLFLTLKKYRALTLALLLLLPTAVPQVWNNIHQSLFAQGVEAIDYKHDGYCELGPDEYGGTTFYCEMTLHNKSSEAVTFELEFLDLGGFDDGEKMFELLNVAGPFVYTLAADDQKKIIIEDEIDLRQQGAQFHGGGGFVHFILKDGQREIVY
ncbi:MAG: hypothetical protein ABS882_04475 [Lysinibacillus sp.]